MSLQTIDERFVLDVEAASGGMGTIYRGRDLASGAVVAIKVLRRAGAAEQQRFVREAAILASLSHPAIVPYVAHGILTDGSPYLVMDWIDGEILDTRMQQPGLSVAESLIVARRIAEALAFAHARGVVHRDIKPSNLIAPAGDLARLMVIDFGVARADSLPGSLTETGAVVGTPSYMAPEQVRGQRTVGPPADVFALGCVLYASLTGRITFQGRRFLALRAKIMFWDPPPVRELAPEVPPAVDALVSRMLAKAPDARPQDGAAVLALLDALPPIEAAPAVLPRRARARPDEVSHRPRTPTTAQNARRVSIIVVTSLEGLEPSLVPPSDELDSMPSSLEDSLLRFGAAVDLLPDGAMIATLTDADTAHEQALAAVRCALVLRQRFPDSLIGVATDEVRAEDEADLIEDLVQALAKDAMATMFSGAVDTGLPPGCIRLDERTAELVEPDFAIVRVKGSSYVRGDAAG